MSEPDANGWMPIESAPSNQSFVLLFGTMEEYPMLNAPAALIFSGYWDAIDESWCCTGSTFAGPFFNPTHWQPLPNPPENPS